ncbi:MAG: hypothetical protein H7175_28040, partial [Burkholderiales bacterium]|nr:hypothetical protein [Anaerolineae bacterium]
MAQTNLLILIGYGSDNFDLLRRELQSHLTIPVEIASLEASPSVGESIQAGVAAHNPRYVIVLPLFVGASEAKNRNVAMIVDGANERGFDMVAYYGKPLGIHPKLIAAYSDQLVYVFRETRFDYPAEDTALLIVGRGSRDANSNAEAYQVARLLYESRDYHSMDVAFYGTTTPKIAAGIQRAVQTGAQRIIVLPYMLYDEHLAQAIKAQVQQQQRLYPDVELLISTGLGGEVNMIQAVSQRYQDALDELTAALSNEGRYISKPHSHGAGGHTHTYRVAGFATNLLPPR